MQFFRGGDPGGLFGLGSQGTIWLGIPGDYLARDPGGLFGSGSLRVRGIPGDYLAWDPKWDCLMETLPGTRELNDAHGSTKGSV